MEGDMKLNICEETEIIYNLMKEIIAERRELSRQYYDLKNRLDELKKPSVSSPNQTAENSKVENSQGEKESEFFSIVSNRTKKMPFERIAFYIIEILRNSTEPVNNKDIISILSSDYGVYLKYSNLVSNILPRMGQSKDFKIEKFQGVIGNIMTEGKSDMVDDKGINYRFIKYIYQAMLNEKMNYIRSSKKKGIVVVHDETLLENAQYQNEQLLEKLTKDHAFNLEEYVNDVDLSNSIAKLTDREKYIVYKRFIEGEKDPAIAKTLGISSQAVSKQRKKIMKKLKTYFEMAP